MHTLKIQKGLTPILIILIIIGVLVVGGGVYFFVKNIKITRTPEVLSQHEIEWTKCQNRQLTTPINWKVKIKEISLLGGLYAKGYLNSESYPVRLRWSPEVDTSKVRTQIKDGDVIQLKGECWGFSESGEVIITVSEINIYE